LFTLCLIGTQHYQDVNVMFIAIIMFCKNARLSVTSNHDSLRP